VLGVLLSMQSGPFFRVTGEINLARATALLQIVDLFFGEFFPGHALQTSGGLKTATRQG
jgi:hypothetical protein